MTTSAYTSADEAEVRRLRLIRRRTEVVDRRAYDDATTRETEIHCRAFRRWDHFRRTGERVAPGVTTDDIVDGLTGRKDVAAIDPEARRSDPWGQPPDESGLVHEDRALPPCGPPSEDVLKSLSKPRRKGPRPAPKF